MAVPTDAFVEFVEITKRLRKECPWDREQTHASIKGGLIEEAYEVAESIDNGNMDELKKELGDLLLQVVFHANLAEETASFTLQDVIEGITKKLIHRHPHIFGDTQVSGAEHVKQNWEKLKMQEGRTSVIEGVPKELPALMRAHRLQDKAAKVGFDWKNREDVWKKVEEEMTELHEAIASENADHIEAEFGDILFSLVNYARFVGVSPENALRRTIEKFISRFNYVEKKLKDAGKDIHDSTLEEMDTYWNEAKKENL